jgi:O-methyltransferase
VSLKVVQQFLSDCSNVAFYPGIFPHTTGAIEGRKFCFVHIDVDLCQSVENCLKFFYDRMLPAGIMVFEGYKWKACPCAKKTIDGFLLDKADVQIIAVWYQYMFIKT